MPYKAPPRSPLPRHQPPPPSHNAPVLSLSAVGWLFLACHFGSSEQARPLLPLLFSVCVSVFRNSGLAGQKKGCDHDLIICCFVGVKLFFLSGLLSILSLLTYFFLSFFPCCLFFLSLFKLFFFSAYRGYPVPVTLPHLQFSNCLEEERKIQQETSTVF